ncbi:MAG: peptidoglycan-binding protein [Porticoccaceae bacterium]
MIESKSVTLDEARRMEAEGRGFIVRDDLNRQWTEAPGDLQITSNKVLTQAVMEAEVDRAEAEAANAEAATSANTLLREYPMLVGGETGGKIDELARLLGRQSASVFDESLQRLAGRKLYDGTDIAAVPLTWNDWSELLPEMKLGDTGPTVGAVQRFLGVPDHHRFDAATVEAVCSFQLAAGFNPTGIVDRAFWRRAFNS